MKKLYTAGLLALSLFAFVSGVRAADFKIATVDLRKAFDSYYRTVAASIANSNAIVERDKQINAMIADRTKLEEDWQKAEEAANNQILPADTRTQNKKEADRIAVAARIQNETISNTYARTELKRRDDMVQHVTDLTAEIRGVMEVMAKKQGYTMILDRTALTMTGNPLVLYTSGENDLTEALIKELNSTAPPDFIVPPAFTNVTSPLPPGAGVRTPLATNAADFVGPRPPLQSGTSGTNSRTPPATPGPTRR
jgi:Skp family chaperone for outer membrane proteins